ncbi:hypothetical protein ACHWQZ_G007124 [Mnemiopsis leidyi]
MSEAREDGPPKKSREDYRKQKELDEARKSGLEPAEQDEFGVDINPHIPQYIKDSPWYLQMDGPTLTHQRIQPETVKSFDDVSKLYQKGLKNKVATKFRKGACTNCGAITHKKIDCLEKPRKIGARWTGRDFAPDEHIPEMPKLDFEGKRDRWIGYDTATHDELLDEFSKIEKVKQQLKAESLNNNERIRQETESKSDSDAEDDEYKYTEQANMPGTKFDNKKRQTVRNLRIREDTAKYLLNLDTNSAHYDPKSRSMRDNPLKDLAHKKPSELSFSGENFVRSTGQVKEIAKLQLFAWDAAERGSNVHLQAEPTKAALLHKEYSKRKDEFKNEVSNSIVEKYGGKEHLKAPPRELLLSTTEEYVEYSRTGKIIKGQERVVPKSKYQEDVHVNGHTSVYGSYFKAGTWGYKCCGALQKQAYCTGAASRTGADAPQAAAEPEPTNQVDRSRPLIELHQEKMVETRKQKKQKAQEDRENPQAREERLKKVLAQLDAKEAAEKAEGLDERKRKYNSMVEDKGPTEEEMEAWKLRKHMASDPMANYSDEKR